MRDQLQPELPLREVFLATSKEEGKQKVKELAELWLDQHPWARRAADAHRREVEARAAERDAAKTLKVGRFSSMLASGEALPAAGYRMAPSFAEHKASSSPSRQPKASKPAPVIQDSLRAKIMALVVASVESHADAERLQKCLESIVAQSSTPRALWVCWYAHDFKLRQSVRELIEEFMPRCIRRGTPLSQLQLEEPLGQWRHVEAVLRTRQQMGGDVCDMWVAIADSEQWHQDRCRQLCEEASKVSNDVPALLLGANAEDATECSSEERWCSSSVLMRLPVLCKFLAQLSPTMLQHRLCDLSFCSYAWNEPLAVLRQQQAVRAGGQGVAQRILRVALDQANWEEVSMEEKRTAFDCRRSAGTWAELISAAEFVRFFMCCHLAAEGLALMQLFGSTSDSVETEVWKGLSEAFQLGEECFHWLQRQAPEFSKQAKLSLGELQEPEEKLELLLRSNKPSHSISS